MLDNHYEEALKEYNEAIHLDPSYTIAFYNRALVYGIQKKFALAIADLDQVLRKNPNDAAALSWRMVDRMALGDQANGNADAARLSAMNPNAQPSNCQYIGNAYMQCARPDGSTYTYRLNVPHYSSGTDACFKNLAGTYFCQHQN